VTCSCSIRRPEYDESSGFGRAHPVPTPIRGGNRIGPGPREDPHRVRRRSRRDAADSAGRPPPGRPIRVERGISPITGARVAYSGSGVRFFSKAVLRTLAILVAGAMPLCCCHIGALDSLLLGAAAGRAHASGSAEASHPATGDCCSADARGHHASGDRQQGCPAGGKPGNRGHCSCNSLRGDGLPSGATHALPGPLQVIAFVPCPQPEALAPASLAESGEAPRSLQAPPRTLLDQSVSLLV